MTVASRARTQMVMRAYVERNATATADVDGHPQAPDWQVHATIACVAWHPPRNPRQEVVDGRKTALMDTIQCAFPLDADVTESDRISNIKDRLGAVLYDGPMTIETIHVRRTYKQATLQRAQS